MTTLETFPCVYTFKVFGRSSDAFADRVREILSETLGPIPRDSVKVRTSRHGRYMSVTVCAYVHSRAQLERAYSDLRADREVLLYI
ncbi:MAG: hypothetical protein KatS3mg076_1668 [Candidatus Binatia bacterium]|nr:MAG: hypothetical protein KatS3mg076_1668 [Candidatus Binatia bacterium]